MLFISIQTINLCATKLCNYRIVGIYTAKHRYTQQSINSMKTLKSHHVPYLMHKLKIVGLIATTVFNLPKKKKAVIIPLPPKSTNNNRDYKACFAECIIHTSHSDTCKLHNKMATTNVAKSYIIIIHVSTLWVGQRNILQHLYVK